MKYLLYSKWTPFCYNIVQMFVQAACSLLRIENIKFVSKSLILHTTTDCFLRIYSH